MEQELDDGGTIDFYYMIPQDTAAFAGFADLHERVSGAPTPLTDNGVVLTEKMAATLGVQAGDTVTLDDGDGELAEFTVTGVCEHYVYNYVYVSAAGYAAAFGSEPEWNAVMSRLTEDSQQARDTLSARLLALDEVASLNFTQDSKDMVLNMLGAIDAVVALIIICAASLAFVVLYNLTNINIAERVKEIATIKVLGFYDREVDAYVNRESVGADPDRRAVRACGRRGAAPFCDSDRGGGRRHVRAGYRTAQLCVCAGADVCVRPDGEPCHGPQAQAYLDGRKHESARIKRGASTRKEPCRKQGSFRVVSGPPQAEKPQGRDRAE